MSSNDLHVHAAHRTRVARAKILRCGSGFVFPPPVLTRNSFFDSARFFPVLCKFTPPQWLPSGGHAERRGRHLRGGSERPGQHRRHGWRGIHQRVSRSDAYTFPRSSSPLALECRWSVRSYDSPPPRRSGYRDHSVLGRDAWRRTGRQENVLLVYANLSVPLNVNWPTRMSMMIVMHRW